MGKHFGKYNAQAAVSISIMFETGKSAEMPYPLGFQWLFLDVPPPRPCSGPLLLSVSLLLCRCGERGTEGRVFPVTWTSEHLPTLN